MYNFIFLGEKNLNNSVKEDCIIWTLETENKGDWKHDHGAVVHASCLTELILHCLHNDMQHPEDYMPQNC